MPADPELHCLICETGWLAAETERCWSCDELGEPDELPEALYKTPAKVALAESKATEKACNTYKRMARPKFA